MGAPSACPPRIMPTTSLVADCARCCALCCVAPAFPATEDFAYEKPAHTPCCHLRSDDRCAIHARLVECGFRGCAVYDCAGAGQKVTQWTFAGRSWRSLPDPRPMFEAFMTVRFLHGLLVLLEAARRLDLPATLATELQTIQSEIQGATFLDARSLAHLDLSELRERCDRLLSEVAHWLRRSSKARRLRMLH